MVSPFYFVGTEYGSEFDEEAQFEWIAKISCIKSVYGRGTQLYLEVDCAQLTQKDLRELKALYQRYEGDITQLSGLRVTESHTIGSER